MWVSSGCKDNVDKLWQHLNNSEILVGTAMVSGEGNHLIQTKDSRRFELVKDRRWPSIITTQLSPILASGRDAAKAKSALARRFRDPKSWQAWQSAKVNECQPSS